MVPSRLDQTHITDAQLITMNVKELNKHLKMKGKDFVVDDDDLLRIVCSNSVTI